MPEIIGCQFRDRDVDVILDREFHLGMGMVRQRFPDDRLVTLFRAGRSVNTQVGVAVVDCHDCLTGPTMEAIGRDAILLRHGCPSRMR